MNMVYSSDGRHLTEQFEGVRLEAYPDSVGVPTIGYGHTSGVRLGDICTQEQADKWLQDDIQVAANAVNRCVTVDLTQGEFDALTDWTFNVGVEALVRSTLLKLLNSGDYNSASKELEKWDRAGGRVLRGLLKRRLAEEKEFNS